MTAAIPSSHTVSFDGVVLRRARFDDLDKGMPVPEAKKQLNVSLELGVGTLGDDRHAYVRLGLAATPAQDPNLFGELEVVMDGLFSVQPDVDPEALMVFCRASGPSLLMPYLRQAVTNLTAFTRGSVVILPPVNMMKLMEEGALAPTALGHAKGK